MFLPEQATETCTQSTEYRSRFPRSFSKWFWLLQNIFEKFLENRVHFFKKCHDFLKKFRDFEKKVNSPQMRADVNLSTADRGAFYKFHCSFIICDYDEEELISNDSTIVDYDKYRPHFPL